MLISTPNLRIYLAFLVLCFCSPPVSCQDTGDEEEGRNKAEVLEKMEIIGITPIHGVGLSQEKVPYAVQSATGDDLQRNQSLDISQFLNRNLGSVTINAAQNNPLQPDLQYRGFSVSPLLGLPQGISVYQNGVRIQESFGDTINWELLPENAIGSINLIGGSNPLYGLNTLGGALSIQTKNGFTHPGHQAEVYGGSWGRLAVQAETGGNNKEFGYFAAVNYFEEDGWRDASPSDVKNFFGSVGWRGAASTLDLSFTYGDSDLIGNGPAPLQLLERDRDAVFTLPDQTRNEMKMGILEASHWLNDRIQISGNAFYRDIDTDSFNGDGTEFDECEDDANEGLRCEEGDGQEEVVIDQFGSPLTEADDGINNIAALDQRAYGANLNNTFIYDLFGLENQLIIGGGWRQGFGDFDANVEVAGISPDRSTTRSGRFIEEEATQVDTRTRSWAVYFTDTLAVTPNLDLTFSGRFNSTKVVIRDRSEENPDLNGDHEFDRFNPAGGVSWRPHRLVNLYASYGESTRAPTAVELVCADEEAPCNLPNAFLADPPLDQVVAKTAEAGFRGNFTRLAGLDLGNVNWRIGGFHAINEDDIIFQSTGGVTASEGFFDNIGDTRRVGAELGFNGTYGIVQWFLNYSYVDASFRDGFFVNSPNHPLADADNTLQVNQGDSIPGIPSHNMKFGADINILPSVTVGWDVIYNSGQYLRGDEANLLNKTGDFVVFNLRGEYRVTDYLAFFAKIDNVFDQEYETFGLFGEPEEILGPDFDNPRLLGPGPERGGWIGFRVSL